MALKEIPHFFFIPLSPHPPFLLRLLLDNGIPLLVDLMEGEAHGVLHPDFEHGVSADELDDGPPELQVVSGDVGQVVQHGLVGDGPEPAVTVTPGGGETFHRYTAHRLTKPRYKYTQNTCTNWLHTENR